MRVHGLLALIEQTMFYYYFIEHFYYWKIVNLRSFVAVAARCVRYNPGAVSGVVWSRYSRPDQESAPS